MVKKDLVKTVKEFMLRNRYSKLFTSSVDGTPHGRMMTHIPPGDDLVIWYATGLSTTKVREIEQNANVNVFVDDPADQITISILGKAEIVTDNKLKKKFWQDAWSFFWPDGPSNPDYCLLRIIPEKVEYLNAGPSYHPKLKREIVKL